MRNRRCLALIFAPLALTAPILASCGSVSSAEPPDGYETASIAGPAEPAALPVARSPPGSTWIVPADCAPGASPASIAAAFDLMKLRCDPERAERVRPFAAAAAALIGRRAMTGSTAARLGSAAARLGGSGGSVTSGYSTSDVVEIRVRSDGRYSVLLSDGNRVVVDQIRITDPRYSGE